MTRRPGVLIGTVLAVLIVAWSLLRTRVVEPRIGSVTFRQERRDTERKGIQGGALFGAGILALFVALFVFQTRSEGGVDAFLQEWIAGLPAVLLALMAIMVAAMTGLFRFMGYGVVLVACGSVGTWLGLEPGAQILIAGGIITLAGATLFTRFLAAHPIPAGLGEEL